MSNPDGPTLYDVQSDRLAARFARLGWFGFVVQLVLLILPVALAVYLIFFSGPSSAKSKGIDLGNYLSWGSLLILLFTTVWFYRYTRLAERLKDTARRPSRAALKSSVWVGVWASCAGIAFSMLLLFAAAWRMLFILLANPQTGIMVAPTVGDNPSQSISAFDAMSLTALLVMLLAELIVLGLSLWLLFDVTSASQEEQTSEAGG